MSTFVEIYSADYDSHENICNGGMSGKVFVTEDGKQREASSIAEAFSTADLDSLEEIVLYYQKDGVQLFKKLSLKSCP